MDTLVGSQEKNVGIVGIGKMGGAIQQVLERNGYQVAGVGRGDDLTAIDGCRFVILGMKPQSLDDSTAANIAAHTDAETITISLLAGTTIAQLTRQGFTSVARVMPNLAAANGDSVTAVYAGDTVINDSSLRSLLESWGACIRLDREDQFADFTALSACGVGFIAKVVATIEEEARQQGLGQQRARNIANGTLRSVASLLSGDQSAAELASRVASRGGATERGYEVMEREGVWRGIVLGIRAAADRTRALGRLASGAKSSTRFGLRLWRNR